MFEFKEIKYLNYALIVIFLVLAFYCGYAYAETKFTATDKEIFNNVNKKIINYPPFPFNENMTFKEIKTLYFVYNKYPIAEHLVSKEIRELCSSDL